MRLRFLPGAVAAGVLTSGASASYGQSADGNGSIELVEFASTATLANEVHQLVQTSPSTYASKASSGILDQFIIGAGLPNSAGDTGLISSVLESSDVILDVTDGPAGGDGSTKQDGTGRTLILAQFN